CSSRAQRCCLPRARRTLWPGCGLDRCRTADGEATGLEEDALAGVVIDAVATNGASREVAVDYAVTTVVGNNVRRPGRRAADGNPVAEVDTAAPPMGIRAAVRCDDVAVDDRLPLASAS